MTTDDLHYSTLAGSTVYGRLPTQTDNQLNVESNSLVNMLDRVCGA